MAPLLLPREKEADLGRESDAGVEKPEWTLHTKKRQWILKRPNTKPPVPARKKGWTMWVQNTLAYPLVIGGGQ